MRVNTPSVAPAVAQSTESKPTAIAAEARPAITAEARPAITAEARPATGFVKNDGFNLTRPFPLPYPQPTPLPLPLPYPMPPIFQPDAQTRATQASQLKQISEGVSTGSITAQEAESLLKEQGKISDYQKQAMSDGFLSQEERLRLNVMQAGAALNTFQASHNGDRNTFARFDGNAQRQADQIGRIADGRRSGNITNTEAGELLRDQVQIADARGDADSLPEHLALNQKLNAADRDINYHSRPGTQFDLKPFPFPRPQPLPLPRPMPLPELRPLPSLPRSELPSKPDFHILPFKGVING